MALSSIKYLHYAHECFYNFILKYFCYKIFFIAYKTFYLSLNAYCIFYRNVLAELLYHEINLHANKNMNIIKRNCNKIFSPIYRFSCHIKTPANKGFFLRRSFFGIYFIPAHHLSERSRPISHSYRD